MSRRGHRRREQQMERRLNGAIWMREVENDPNQNLRILLFFYSMAQDYVSL
jgi:hypothetical protein